MLNRTGVKTEKFGNVNQILFAVDHQVSVGIVVAQAVGEKQPDGRTIAKAGTPVTGNLDKRTTAFTKANVDGSDVVGILLHDVDVTVADANATLLLHGFVNTNRIDGTTKAKLDSRIIKALPTIKFMAC